MSFTARVRAESIADTVRKHVKQGLTEPTKDEKTKADPPRPKDTAKPDLAPQKDSPKSDSGEPKLGQPAPGSTSKALQSTQPASSSSSQAASPSPTPPPKKAEPPSSSGVSFSWSSDGSAKEPPPPSGPPIPHRVFGNYLRLDPKFGGGLRGWVPASYPTVKTHADTYYTWSLDVSGTFLRYITLHRGYYESNGISGPRHQGAAVAAEAATYAKKAAWLLGVVGFPITKTWEPIIRYESRAFQTRAIPQQPVRIVPFNTAPETALATISPTTSPLTMVSGFETFVVGMRYNQSGEPPTVGQRRTTLPPFYFGVGFTQYSKPYQVTVDDSVLDSVLFDARFRGAGLALGATLPQKPDFLILDASVQFGLGEVRLLDKLSLNELLPNTPSRSGLKAPEWVIGYLEGDVTLGYLYTLLRTKPSVLVSVVGNGGGARFYYIKTRKEQGEAVNMPSLNWDFLWGVMGYVTIPL